MKSKVGFVLTNFNNSSLTVQAVESVFENGRETDHFIVVVDNCSREDEVNILREVDGIYENVHVIYNPENAYGLFSSGGQHRR